MNSDEFNKSIDEEEDFLKEEDLDKVYYGVPNPNFNFIQPNDEEIDMFDLEQAILDNWHIVDDLKLLSESILEKDLTKDQISNILIGLEELYKLKFEKTIAIFEALVSKGKI